MPERGWFSAGAAQATPGQQCVLRRFDRGHLGLGPLPPLYRRQRIGAHRLAPQRGDRPKGRCPGGLTDLQRWGVKGARHGAAVGLGSGFAWWER